jgi:hypothetical protein
MPEPGEVEVDLTALLGLVPQREVKSALSRPNMTARAACTVKTLAQTSGSATSPAVARRGRSEPPPEPFGDRANMSA